MYGSPRRRCQSAGLTLAACTFSRTSSSLRVGLSTSVNSRASGGPYFMFTIAFMVLLQGRSGAAPQISRGRARFVVLGLGQIQFACLLASLVQICLLASLVQICL